MNRHERVRKELDENGTSKMTVTGNSMMPVIKTKSTLTFEPREDYQVGDIVFCKVKGRTIDAHLITKKDTKKGYLISNNHGFDNGWTKTIWGKVTHIEPPKN